MRHSSLLLGLWLVGCGAPPVQGSGAPTVAVVARGQASPRAESRSRVWLHEGPEVVGVEGSLAFHWDSSNLGQIVATNVKTGATVSSQRVDGAKYNGQPSLWAPVPNGYAPVWDAPNLIVRKGKRLEVSWRPKTARWSTTLVAGQQLTSWQHEPTPEIVAHSVADGHELWRTPIEPGANGYDLSIVGDQLLVVWQQYAANAPSPRVTIAQRVRAIGVDDGAVRWTQDFRVHTGGIIANGNTLVVARALRG